MRRFVEVEWRVEKKRVSAVVAGSWKIVSSLTTITKSSSLASFPVKKLNVLFASSIPGLSLSGVPP